MDNKQVGVLNHVLEGTYLGIDSFTKYLNNIDDTSLRHKLEDQEKLYRDNATQLSSHIRDLGGNPSDNPGLKGIMTNVTSTMKLMGKDKTVKALEMIRNGVETAIDTKEEAMRELSGESRQLIESQLQNDKTILSEVKNYLDGFRH